MSTGEKLVSLPQGERQATRSGTDHIPHPDSHRKAQLLWPFVHGLTSLELESLLAVLALPISCSLGAGLAHCPPGTLLRQTPGGLPSCRLCPLSIQPPSEACELP